MSIRSYMCSGTGFVLVETTEEDRYIESCTADLVAHMGEGMQAAVVVDDSHADVCPVVRIAARKGEEEGKPKYAVNQSDPLVKSGGLRAGIKWASERGGRVLFVLDAHPNINTQVKWRLINNAAPLVRHAPPFDDEAAEDGENKTPSLLVFIAPAWFLSTDNVLKDKAVITQFLPPSRDEMAEMLEDMSPLGEDREPVLDALCGLTGEAAMQAAAEVLVRTGGKYDPAALAERKEDILRRNGLEVWRPAESLGGLGQLKEILEDQVIPFIDDRLLRINKILCGGLPGTGKSYFARWLSHKLMCVIVRLSMPNLKGSLVGESEQNLRKVFNCIRAMARESKVIVVIDEVDTIQRDGHDGGTSSGMFQELLVMLQEDTSQAIWVSTLNRLDNLDPALESRHNLKLFFDLPTLSERVDVARIHAQRVECGNVDLVAQWVGEETKGFSSREIAESVIPSLARVTRRNPISKEQVKDTVSKITPASITQAEELERMRKQAAKLLPANDKDAAEVKTSASARRVISKKI